MLLQVTNFRSFLWLISITVYTYHIVFTHSSVDGDLRCFHILAIVNNAAKWALDCLYLFKLVFFLDIFPGVELLGHMVVRFSVFWEASKLFSTVPTPVCQIIPVVYRCSLFSTNIGYLCFEDSCSDRCEVLSQCSFDLNFPDDQGSWASFHEPVGHLHVLSEKMSIHVICPCLIGLFDFLNYELFVFIGY